MFRKPVGPLLIALAAGLAALAAIAPEGNGPGVTCDELYHVHQGKRLVTAVRQQGFAFFLPQNIEDNFPWRPGGPPVQAPLGHWILGWTHYLFDPAPDDPSVVSIAAARFAPAIAFALLVLMVGVWTARAEGRLAGTFAAASVALVPRVFGHAHLAALDMLTTLFFVAAVFAAAEAAFRGGRWWHFALAGIVWGLATLVRLHGLLVAPPVVAWLLWRSRRWGSSLTQRWDGSCTATPGATVQLSPQHERSTAVLPIVAWLAAGGATFFIGWPWLWPAPFARFAQFLSSGTGRQALHVFYAGQVWNDRQVPWHYAWVMFVATLPVGLLALGLLGFWVKRFGGTAALGRATSSNGPGSQFLTAEGGRAANAGGGLALVSGTLLFVLLVFSLPGRPVYDGVRLFLMVFPLWAVWAGIGARWLSAWPSMWRMAAVVILVAFQGAGLLLYHPCHLSHYSLLVGGLAGAEKLGFEVTYWGDTVREPMLAEAARLSPGRPVLFAPSLAPFQAPAVEITSPSLREAKVELVGWNKADPGAADRCRYVVIYHRRADFAEVEWLLGRGKTVAEYQEQGVWLARLIELSAPLDAHPGETRID